MCPIELSREAREFLDRHARGHLATANRNGEPHVVPVCYACVHGDIYFVCDEKPKRAGPKHLKRLTNLRENPRAALVVDDYDEDWSKLAYLLVHLVAEIVTDPQEYAAALIALRRRYAPYIRMELQADTNPIVRLRPTSAHFWSAAPR
jgi:PPOX class probable F420-dependent enzyme